MGASSAPPLPDIPPSADELDGPEFLDEPAAAEWLGLSVRTLAEMRREGTIDFFRLFERKGIRYKRSDLLAFAEARRVPARRGTPMMSEPQRDDGPPRRRATATVNTTHATTTKRRL